MEKAQKTHGIKAIDRFGYALGDMGGILTFSLVNSFLTMFYTDILKIANTSIVVLMLVARIWMRSMTPCGAHLSTPAAPQSTADSVRIFSPCPCRWRFRHF